jgi:hypothetical protein
MPGTTGCASRNMYNSMSLTNKKEMKSNKFKFDFHLESEGDHEEDPTVSSY